MIVRLCSRCNMKPMAKPGIKFDGQQHSLCDSCSANFVRWYVRGAQNRENPLERGQERVA